MLLTISQKLLFVAKVVENLKIVYEFEFVAIQNYNCMKKDENSAC